MLTEPFYETAIFQDLIVRGSEFEQRHFDECRFQTCDFSEAVFTNCSFSDCHFTNCNLSMMKIPGCQINNCTFEDCKMIGMDWTAAEWRKTRSTKKVNFSTTFTRCTMDYSIFIAMNLVGIKFTTCSLKDVGFESADMQSADFGDSDLERALFADTILNKADFSRSRSYSFDVRRNPIRKARFSMPEATALLYALDIEIS